MTTTNTYLELKNRHSNEFNDFPMFFAFSNDQLKEGLAKIGLKPTDTDKIYSGGGGMYYRKTEAKNLKELVARHTAEMDTAIKTDSTGEGFIFDMFNDELANHEYCYTHDTEDTLDALGLTGEDIENNKTLSTGLKAAMIAQSEES